MPLLCDTGILYALADRDDAWHARATRFFEQERQVLLAPVTVLPEVAYLLRTRLGPAAERAFAESLAAGELAVENLSARDLARCAELLADQPFLGLVDASIVAIAERLKLAAVVTTDRRDFLRVRPRHVQAFQLLP
jgi:predicted nucleic acid-binding protein